MCGIFGYIGEKDPVEVCLKGLELLEYRGYDSTGISGVSNGKIVLCKKAGNLSFLKKAISLPKLSLGIGHTRWATHGNVTDENAHPHTDEKKSLSLVHNGIIENFLELQEPLLKEGIQFQSQTDTEVIANLVEKNYEGNLLEAMQKTTKLLKGQFALLLIHENHPDEIIAAAKDCPLSIAINIETKEAIISSDPNALLGENFEVLFLNDGEIAKIQKGSIEVYSSNLQKAKKKLEKLITMAKAPSKEGFEHFLLKEIFEQPTTVQKALFGRLDLQVRLDELKLTKNELNSIENVLLLGCGTSSLAAEIGVFYLNEFANLRAQAEISSEVRYKKLLFSKTTLTLAISQSGETADTLAAMKEIPCDYKKIGICNVINSTLSRVTDGNLFLKAGPEISVCSTKAFTSQLTVLLLLSLFFSQEKKILSSDEVQRRIEEIKTIPALIQLILDKSEKILEIAKKYSSFENFFFLGRNYMLPTCMEAALKLKELSYVNANGYPAGELKHGPIALIDENFPVIAFAANQKTEEKMMSNLMEVKARKAPLFTIAFEGSTQFEKISDDIFYIPKTSDPIAPFTASIVGQLFGYFIAKLRGCSIDQPRNLAKSVTVE